MKHDRGVVLGVALLALALLAAPVALAQSAPVDDDDDDRYFGLYVGFSYGDADADDIDTSVETLSTHLARSTVSLEGQDHARAAIGWRFNNDKGDLRLVFHGFLETEYTAHSVGLLDRTASGANTSGLVPWWDLTINDGQLTAIRSPPTWTTANDTDGDGVPDANEVQPGTADRTITTLGPESLENQLQTIDVVYGREFGSRRWTSHWWTGLRYFAYEGNLASGAWLSTLTAGQGFTDGSLLKPLMFYQQATGLGPTASWGAELNLFDRGVQFYVQAQSAFLFNSLDVDSEDFFTIVRQTGSGSTPNVFAPGRLTESRDKSSWQNSIEVGARANFRNGLQLEAGYFLNGYLDVLLRPFDIQIPEGVNQVRTGTSALYNTQDVRLEGWHAGLSYQF